MERKLTCILCPQGCSIETVVQGNNLTEVRGNKCPRGKNYAREEIFQPTRTLTTTVKITRGVYPVVPAKSAKPIPKEKLFQAMAEVKNLSVVAPVEAGVILLPSLAKTGIPLVATRTIAEEAM